MIGSTICKAGAARAVDAVAFITGSGILKRVRNLLMFDNAAAPPSTPPVMVAQTVGFTALGTTFSLTLSTPATAGDSLVLAFMTNNIPTPSNVHDDAGNVYTLDFDNNQAGIGHVYFYRCGNIVGSPTQILWDTDIEALFLACAWEWQNIANAAPISTSAQSAAAVSTFTVTFGSSAANSAAMGFSNCNALRTPTAVAPTIITKASPDTVQFGFYRNAGLADNDMTIQWVDGDCSPAAWGVLYGGI